MEGRPDAQEDLEPVTGPAAVVAVEFARPEIERDLPAEADVDLVAVGKIANITN